MVIGTKKEDTLDHKAKQENNSQGNAEQAFAVPHGNSIKLPGLEIGFPTTWSGSIFGIGILTALVIIFLSFSSEFREKWASNVFDIVDEQKDNPSKPSFQDSIAVIKDENQSLRAKLDSSENVISQLESDLDAIKTSLSKSDFDKNDVNKLVAQASIDLNKTKEAKIITKTAEETAKEIVTELATQEPYRVLVKYFFKKRNFWTGNYYWVSLSLVQKDVLGEHPSLIDPKKSLFDAINLLVDLKVLAKTQMKGGTIGYGVHQNSPTFEIFKGELGLNK